MANDRHDRSPTDRSRAPAATATRAEIDAFLAQAKGLAPTAEPGPRARPARAAHLRPRRDHEPSAHVGYGLSAAGGHVPRGGGDRRARRAAGLLPWPQRMPGLALGLTGRAAERADGAHRLPRRPYPDRPDQRPSQAGNPDYDGAGPGLPPLRHGSKRRRT